MTLTSQRRGESLEDVRRELGDAIETFLSYTADLPQDEQTICLNRKAPLGLRMRMAFLYRLFALLNSLKIRASDRGFSCAGFVVNHFS